LEANGQMNKAQKFALFVLLAITVFLYVIYQTQAVTFDWNGMFNGTLQSLLSGVILIPITVLVYRFLYHRRSNR